MDSTTSLQSILEAIEAFRVLIYATAYIVGFCMAITGILKARDYAENPNQTPFRVPFMFFLVGVLLIWIPSFLGSTLETLFQTRELSEFSYNFNGEEGARLQLTMTAIIRFVQLVGLIGFFKGVILLKNLGASGQQGDGAFAKALTHILGGALAINIVAAIKLFAATVGMDTSAFIN